MPKPVENIMVVPQYLFHKWRHENTLITGHDAVHLFHDMMKLAEFKERNDDLENNTDWRQVIPYVLVEHRAVNSKYLVATRSKQQGESRLWGKSTVGVGGHVNDAEAFARAMASQVGPIAYVMCGARREYEEETGWKDFTSMFFEGFIIANESKVDQVHVGVLFHHVTKNEELNSPEAPLHNHRWMYPHELSSAYHSFEGWSKIVLGEYFPNVV
jgi:predicted NUDIX family phosphoesterase